MEIATFVCSICALLISLVVLLLVLAKLVETQIEMGHEKAQAIRELASEKRMNTNAIDELRIETRQALKTAGVEPVDLEDHNPPGKKP